MQQTQGRSKDAARQRQQAAVARHKGKENQATATDRTTVKGPRPKNKVNMDDSVQMRVKGPRPDPRVPPAAAKAQPREGVDRPEGRKSTRQLRR